MSDRYTDEELMGRLARQNPTLTTDLDGAHRSATAVAAFRAIVSVPRARPWWRRPRVTVPLAVAVAAAAAAAGFAISRPVTRNGIVGCYQGPTLNSRVRIAPVGVSAIATCAGVWSSGELGSARHGPLVECVEGSGVAAVFPTRNAGLCADLGLATPRPTPQSTLLTSLFGDLSAVVNQTTCVSPGQMRVAAQAALLKEGLSSWPVAAPYKFTTAEPCSGFYIDPVGKRVMLIPEMKRSS